MNRVSVESQTAKCALETIEQLLAEPLQQVTSQIQRTIVSDYALVNQSAAHLFNAGGKRIRPILLLLTSGLTGGIKPESIELAAALEIIHTATLIHDDIVDESPFRRGQPSVNGKWGNQVAVLVGDYLYAKASTLAVQNGIQRYARMLAEATTEMCLGEIRQIEQEGNFEIPESEYLQIIRRKTGILMSVSAELGGIVNDIPKEESARLKEFGLKLGIVFQMIDDTLDFTANLSRLGKPTNHDFYQGKITLPLIHLRDTLEPQARARLLSLADRTITESDIIWLNKMIDQHHSVEYVRNYARNLVDEANELLLGFPESVYKTALLRLGEYIIHRDK
ncbi:MAG: polyprenyl synthetase family protein [bacterium]|nr:polyprenyl synthetase family protein [bacterium]